MVVSTVYKGEGDVCGIEWELCVSCLLVTWLERSRVMKGMITR